MTRMGAVDVRLWSGAVGMDAQIEGPGTVPGSLARSPGPRKSNSLLTFDTIPNKAPGVPFVISARSPVP